MHYILKNQENYLLNQKDIYYINCALINIKKETCSNCDKIIKIRLPNFICFIFKERIIYHINFKLLIIDKSWNYDFMNKEYFSSQCKFLYSLN